MENTEMMYMKFSFKNVADTWDMYQFKQEIQKKTLYYNNEVVTWHNFLYSELHFLEIQRI